MLCETKRSIKSIPLCTFPNKFFFLPSIALDKTIQWHCTPQLEKKSVAIPEQWDCSISQQECEHTKRCHVFSSCLNLWHFALSKSVLGQHYITEWNVDVVFPTCEESGVKEYTGWSACAVDTVSILIRMKLNILYRKENSARLNSIPTSWELHSSSGSRQRKSLV